MLEILDSAQESFPHLFVNGEKYVFSDDVLTAGDNLSKSFEAIREFALKFTEFREELRQSEFEDLLLKFEHCWTTYEQYYVYELMVIESDARRFIIEAIELGEQLNEIEKALSEIDCNIQNNRQYNETREKLIVKLSMINAVTNVNGSGRDDLTDIKILKAAEEIPNRLLIGQA